MPVYTSMGLKKIYVNETTGSKGVMPQKGTSWKDLGDVYQDTCQLVDNDPEVTQHKSETSSRKITQIGSFDTSMTLSLMDPDLDLLARYFGGTITGTSGARKWIRPAKPTYKEWGLYVQPEEGIFLGCPCVVIVPKFEITYSEKGICLVPLTIQFQDQLVADESMTDPTTA